MRQLTYTLDNNLSAEELGRIVSTHPAYVSASFRLQIVFEPNCDRDRMQRRLSQAAQFLPDATTIGMTTLGPASEATRVPSQTTCTFLLFDQSVAHVNVYDCHEMSPQEAGERYGAELSQMEDVRGILCLSSRAKLCPAPFIDAIAEIRPDVPVFGTQAGTTKLSNDQSVFFVNDHIYDCGILAVAFCGKDLHVHTDYNLGWRAIGKDLTITGYDGNGFVSTIDGNEAVSIYRRYLNVEPDDYFFENVCSFPLLMQSGRRLIARVPLDYTADGKLQFSMELEQDARVRFSYTKPEYLLQGSLASANEMARFCPQALLLFACLNRRVFLGNEKADREFEYYKNACPDMVWSYGYGEILRTGEGGGIFNSTIVAVGMREGEPVGDGPAPYVDADLVTNTTFIPLPERLVTFLEATTAELHDTIDELAQLAERDQLTGIYNRRRMDELLHYELSKRGNGSGLVLLMYDVDHFKRINDSFGHDTGDIVLKDLTKYVSDIIRAGDTLGRWGGEEFLCLLTDTSLSEGRVVAERLRRAVENSWFGRVGRVTVSVGVTCAEEADTPESLFQRVDKALYDAKHAGRNCVCVR